MYLSRDVFCRLPSPLFRRNECRVEKGFFPIQHRRWCSGSSRHPAPVRRTHNIPSKQERFEVFLRANHIAVCIYRGLKFSAIFASIMNMQKSARGGFAKEKRPSSVIAIEGSDKRKAG